jgi:hypothetical protein
MGQGLYPEAIKKRINPGENDPRIVPSMAILHVAVTDIKSLFRFFNGPSGGIESHFYIRKSGKIEQYRSVNFEADANYKANSYEVDGVVYGAVSIETAGFALGWWNKEQKQAIKALLKWLHEEHGIPLKPVTKALPPVAEGGVGYHSQFKSWSPVAKSCPGPNRIRQFNDKIRLWMANQTNCLHCPVHCPR